MENTRDEQLPDDNGYGHGPATGSAVESAGGGHMPSASMIATGVVTALTVTAITNTGRKLIGTLAKSPLLMFSAGLVAGYYAHKHRQEILSTVGDAAERGKAFVLQQREHIEDMLAEGREAAEDAYNADPQP